MIEMSDLGPRRPPSSIHRPPDVFERLSSRPDIFYTGSFLQVRLCLLVLLMSAFIRQWQNEITTVAPCDIVVI